MTERVRLEHLQRKQVIDDAILRVARDKGLFNVTHGNVAERCTVQTSISGMKAFYRTKRDLLQAAINMSPDAAEKAEWAALAKSWGMV